ncbi:uncharacterized protein LOC142339798 isoform X2 [Convolutriloba macropyga]
MDQEPFYTSGLRPEWQELITNYGIDSSSIGTPVESANYPNFAPPLLETTPLLHFQTGLQIHPRDNERLWNYFWTSRSIAEQSDAFGTRPMLLGWLMYSDQHNDNLNLIRDPSTFKTVMLTLEGFIPSDFPNEPQSFYLTLFTWSKNFAEELFVDDKSAMRNNLTTEGETLVRDAGIDEQIANGALVYRDARTRRLRGQNVSEHCSPASLREAIKNNPDVFTTPEERFNLLTSQFEKYRAGRRVHEDIAEPTPYHVLNIGLETGGNPSEARALFLQQQARQKGLQSELDTLNQSQHDPETPGSSTNHQLGC